MRKTIILFLIIAYSISVAWGGSVNISIEYQRGSRGIQVGDPFYLVVEVKDLDGKPELPSSIPGGKLAYFHHSGQSSSMTSINGNVTQTTSNIWTATIKAQKEGKYSLGPILVNGVKSNVVKYTIGGSSSNEDDYDRQSASTQGSAGADNDKPKFIGKGDGNLFLRASVNSQNVYEQQALVYTVKLYTTYDAIKFIGATAAPKFDGFVTEESKDISKSLSFETYNGKSYATAVIARYVIFPQMTGNLKISGNTYTVAVDQREYYRDPFFGNMSFNTPLQLNVTPNDLTINVRALPEPKPADFSGGVGKFSISSSLAQNTLKTNQVASIVYTVSGRGNLKYIQMPDLSSRFPSEFEVYTPTTKVDSEVSGGTVEGTATFDYSFLPLEIGNYSIPSVNFVYFDPETGRYETATAKGYQVSVAKGAVSSKSQTSSRLRFDSALQEVNAADLSKNHRPWISALGYWLFYILPTTGLVLAVFYQRKYAKEHADLAIFNMKQANKVATKRLKRAHKALKANDRELFYTELLSACWGYLSDKLNVPTSELMRDNIRVKLESAGVAEDVVSKMISLIDECEYAKYSPDPKGEGMKTSYEEATLLINDLENKFKRGSK